MGNEETKIQNKIRVAVSRLGARVFRNNVGQWKDKKGHVIRYGVCNPGGSDLIGWVPVKITEDMVGETFAVFLAIEVKVPGESPTFDQENFIEQVNQAGGVAFWTDTDENLEGEIRCSEA